MFLESATAYLTMVDLSADKVDLACNMKDH